MEVKNLKKITILIVGIIIAVASLFYILDHQRMKQGDPVIFSTWGKKYTPTENEYVDLHYFQALEYGHPEEVDYDETKSIVLQNVEEQQKFNELFSKPNPLTTTLNYDEDFYKDHTIILTMFWATALTDEDEYSLTKLDIDKNKLMMEITYTSDPDKMYAEIMTPYYQLVVIPKTEINAETIKVVKINK